MDYEIHLALSKPEIERLFLLLPTPSFSAPALDLLSHPDFAFSLGSLPSQVGSLLRKDKHTHTHTHTHTQSFVHSGVSRGGGS